MSYTLHNTWSCIGDLTQGVRSWPISHMKRVDLLDMQLQQCDIMSRLIELHQIEILDGAYVSEIIHLKAPTSCEGYAH